MAEQLVDSDGSPISFDAGESGNVFAAAYNAANPPVQLTKAQLLTLTVTLFDRSTRAVINSRNAQNIIDANGGTVATDGAITFRLQPLDNVMVGSGDSEEHVTRFTWTWNDGSATRTGIKEYAFRVNKLASVS